MLDFENIIPSTTENEFILLDKAKQLYDEYHGKIVKTFNFDSRGIDDKCVYDEERLKNIKINDR